MKSVWGGQGGQDFRVGICDAEPFDQSIKSYLNGAKSQPEESGGALHNQGGKPSEAFRASEVRDGGQEKAPAVGRKPRAELHSRGRIICSKPVGVKKEIQKEM